MFCDCVLSCRYVATHRRQNVIQNFLQIIAQDEATILLLQLLAQSWLHGCFTDDHCAQHCLTLNTVFT